MARTTLELPSHFPFSASIPVRITDLNYGGHVGNDTILSLIHEARMKFLAHYGYTEKNLGGVGLIMGDAVIVFKNELFYGEELVAQVAAGNIGAASFDLFYKLQKKTGNKTIDVAHAKTGMVCFDYEKRKVCTLPEAVRLKW